MVWFDPAAAHQQACPATAQRARSTIPTGVARVAGYNFDAVVMMGWGHSDWRLQAVR